MKSHRLQKISYAVFIHFVRFILAFLIVASCPTIYGNADEWVQINVDGFDSNWDRAKYNYGVFDDSLTVYDGKLYAGTDNPINGSEIWVYAGDGTTSWTKVSGESIPGKSIFYGGEATEFLYGFNGYLYAGSVYGVMAPMKQNGQLWRTDIPEDPETWTKVFDYDDWLANPSGGDTGDLLSAIEYNGYFYLSASAVESGNRNAQIFRSADGVNWEKVLDGDSPNGFNDNDAVCAYPFEIFNNELYIGVTNDNDGAEIWKTDDGIDWTQVNTDGMAADTYQGDREVIRQLITYDNYLYAFLKNYNGTAWVEVWRSQYGTDWSQVGGNGLGDPSNNKDGRGVEVYSDCLYVGTGGMSPYKARVYRSCDGVTFSDITGGWSADLNNHGVMAMKQLDNYLYAATFRWYSPGFGGAEVWRYNEPLSTTTIPTTTIPITTTAPITTTISQMSIYGKVTGGVLENITINLYEVSCGGASLVSTTKTNADGSYLFTNLSGTYNIQAVYTGCGFSPVNYVNVSPLDNVSRDFISTCTPPTSTTSSIPTTTSSTSTTVCTYSIAPTSQKFTYSGGTGTVNVSAQSGCSWTAKSHAAWIVITSGSSGSGNGTVRYTVRRSISARNGTMTIAGQTFNVVQSR